MLTALQVQQPLNPALPKESLMAEYKNLQTPSLILTNIHCRTYNDVLTSNHPTLREAAEKSGEWRVFVLSYISAGITNYLDFIGRRSTMNDQQVAETASLILEEYPDYKFDDIVLFFRMCKLARFGRLYDINGSAIFDWLHQYDDQRWSTKNKLDKKAHEQEEIAQAAWEARLNKERSGGLKSVGETAGSLINQLKNKDNGKERINNSF